MVSKSMTTSAADLQLYRALMCGYAQPQTVSTNHAVYESKVDPALPKKQGSHRKPKLVVYLHLSYLHEMQ